MKAPQELTVQIADAGEFLEIRDLIIQGLTERWGQYNPAFNPDLESFAECYKNAVVVAAKRNGEIVGCGILIKERDVIGRIVRMSVAGERRRAGIGSRILDLLLQHATSLGYREVVLETTATWESAVEFYKCYGFTPTVLVAGDQHFRLELRELGDG